MTYPFILCFFLPQDTMQNFDDEFKVFHQQIQNGTKTANRIALGVGIATVSISVAVLLFVMWVIVKMMTYFGVI